MMFFILGVLLVVAWSLFEIAGELKRMNELEEHKIDDDYRRGRIQGRRRA